MALSSSLVEERAPRRPRTPVPVLTADEAVSVARDLAADLAAGSAERDAQRLLPAAEIDRLSNRVMTYSGVSDELVKQGAAILLTFRGVRNEIGKGNDIFTQAIELSADLAAALANARGGEDNITVALVRCDENEPPK